MCFAMIVRVGVIMGRTINSYANYLVFCHQAGLFPAWIVAALEITLFRAEQP